MDHNIKKSSWFIKAICFNFSCCFFLAALVATIYLNLWGHVWKDFIKLLVQPGPLVTDYFMLGNIASAFLNAGICGMTFTLLMIYLKVECRPSYLAGYFLVVAHCFYGLNFLNMWPPVLGILLFTKVFRIGFRHNLIPLSRLELLYCLSVSSQYSWLHLRNHFQYFFGICNSSHAAGSVKTS